MPAKLKRLFLRIFPAPGFWTIVFLLVLISILHYSQASYPLALGQRFSSVGLSEVAFERALYLVPVSLAGWFYGWGAALATSVAAFGLMLAHSYLSGLTPEAMFGVTAIFILGNLLAAGAWALREKRQYRKELEIVRHELRVSEASYRYLFENAHDAIWLHDLEGNFITVNKATEMLTGYSREELSRMNVKSFLSTESLELAQKIRRRLLNNEKVEQPYEQRIFRRDGSEAYIQLATSVVFDKGKPVAFQHIARDITEQRRMNQNLRFYFQQAIRAQEEERKRISHELHDDTIQSLVVLSRQLDALAASQPELPAGMRQRLEELWQQTDSILKGLRRLSQDLRPPALDRLGLLPAIEMLAAEVSKYSNIATKVNAVGKEHRLPEEVTIALFRITQEALRNVWRHSGATQAEVTVEFTNGRTRITVSDNGKGFQVPAEMSDLAKDGKLGLAGMQERAQLIGGVLTVRSAPGMGTTVTIEAPG